MIPQFGLVSEIRASVDRRVPDASQLDEPSAWAQRVLGVMNVPSFLEGPVFDIHGRLHVVDLAHGRILRWETDGRVTVLVHEDGEPNGLAIHRDGRIYVADHRRGILAYDPDGSNRKTLVDAAAVGLHGVNDLTFDEHGSLYFTDQGWSDILHPYGRVFRLSADGELTVLVDGIASPNGLALSPDQRILYVAVTRANQVWRVPLRPDGKIGRVGVHLYLSGSHGGPDGLAVDADGGLAVVQYGSGRVWLYDHLGVLRRVVVAPQGLGVTNVAYGGPQGRTLYVTESDTGAVLTAELETPGLRLYSHG